MAIPFSTLFPPKVTIGAAARTLGLWDSDSPGPCTSFSLWCVRPHQAPRGLAGHRPTQRRTLPSEGPPNKLSRGPSPALNQELNESDYVAFRWLREMGMTRMRPSHEESGPGIPELKLGLSWYHPPVPAWSFLARGSPVATSCLASLWPAPGSLILETWAGEGAPGTALGLV